MTSRVFGDWWRLPAGTVATGVLAAVAGVALLALMRLVQHVTFGFWHGSFLFGVEGAAPPHRAIGMAVGGAVVGVGWWIFRKRVDAEEVSVTHALRDPQARLPPLRAITDAALQIVGVGAGASLGREGAARQAAAALGGWAAGLLGIGPAERRVLIACGAGAGLAALYNVPVSGVLYTLEVLLALGSLRAVIPAVATSVIATVLSWTVLGNEPTYHIAPVSFAWPLLVWALLLGPVAGVLGVGFMKLMTSARTHPPHGPWVIAGTTISFGILGVVGMALPEMLGNGKSMAEFLFLGGVGVGLALLLTVLKPLVTAMCLRGGAIGGLLTPSYSTGAALGLLGGLLWSRLWPGAPPLGYAIIGSAALLSVTQRAPLTSIALAIEFVHTGLELLPAIIIAVALAMGTAYLTDRKMAPLAWPTVQRWRASRNRAGTTQGEQASPGS